MNITLESYENALKGFTDDVGLMKDDVVSVLLFGSMAREDVRPPLSDVMDAFVFLRPEVFQDRARFLKALEIMVGACERLSQTGIHYHPFLYWENFDVISASFLPIYSECSSKIVFGQDKRRTIKSTPASRLLAGRTFFPARRYAHRLTYLLSKPDWNELERGQITSELITARKYFPIFACLTLGLFVGEAAVFRELERALPDVDTSVLEKVRILRDQPESIEDTETLRQLMKEMLTFIEKIHDRLLVKIREAGSKY